MMRSAFRACLRIMLLSGFAASPALAEDPALTYRKMVEAAMSGDIKSLEAAVAAGAPVNQVDRNAIPPLAHAIKSGRIDSVRWLLAHGADLKSKVYGGTPLLSYALRLQDEGIIRELLNAGADIMDPGSPWTPNSPVQAVLEAGSREMLEEFARRGVDFSKPLPDDESPMRVAIFANNLDAVRFLLDGRAGANDVMKHNNYPLADAAVMGNPEVVKVLLEHGADPKAVSQGRPIILDAAKLPHTALVDAVRRNSLPVVTLLLKAGADPNALDGAAIKWADLLGNQHIFDLLIQNGARQPAPYAFLDLPALRREGEAPVRKEASFIDSTLLSILNTSGSPTQSPATAPANISMALIPVSEGCSDVAALLSASLSKNSQISLVEREQLRALGAEQLRSADARFDPAALARGGHLEGADFAVFLSGNAEQVEMRLVETSTGLVLWHSVAGRKSVAPAWAEGCADAIIRSAGKASGDLSKHMAVSIPVLNAGRSTPEGDLLVQQLRTGLGIFLGSQPDILVLDRREMSALSLEKNLKGNVQAFVRSGYLIDGGVEFPTPQEMVLTLRARTVQGEEKATSKVSGPVSQSGKLLLEAGNALLSQLGKPEVAATDSSDEAKAYQEEALTAYSSKLWSQAHSLAQTAEALGCSGEDFLKLRILAICKLIKSDLIALSAETRKIRDDKERDILSKAMPLEFQPSEGARRSPADYLDLAHELLNLVGPVLQKEEKPDKSRQSIWEYLPSIFEVANLPLEMLCTLSDQEAYQHDLESLRRKMLEMSDVAIRKTKAWGFANTCRSLIVQRSQLVKYWITDESLAIKDILAAVEEAHACGFPYVLPSLMDNVTGRAWFTPSRITTRISLFPEALAAALANSDLPQARLIGAMRMRSWCLGRKDQNHWGRKALEAFETAYVTDKSPFGKSHYSAPEESPPTMGRMGAFDSPTSMSSAISWFAELPGMSWANGESMTWDCPRDLAHPADNPIRLLDPDARKLFEGLIDRRLEFMAREGGALFHFLVPPEQADDAALERWSGLAREVSARLKVGVEAGAYTRVAQSDFDSKVSEKIRLTLAARRAGKDNAPLGMIAGFQPQKLPEFRGRKLGQSGAFLNVRTQTGNLALDPRDDTREVAWVALVDGGFLEISSDSKPLRAVPFPDDVNCGELMATSERYLVADLENYETHKKVVSIYDFGKKKWTSLGRKSRPAALLLDGQLVLRSVSHPNGDPPQDADDDERTTYLVEVINPETLEATPLVSSRRTPPQSPLDNSSGRGPYLPERASDTAFFCRNNIYDVREKAWRTPSKEDRQLVVAYRSSKSYPAMAPWEGTVFGPDFDPGTGMLVFPAHIRVPVTAPEGGTRTQTHYLKIPVPPPQIVVADPKRAGTDSGKQAGCDIKSFAFSHYRTAVIAYNSDTVAYIPASLYVPRLQKWLEENSIPKGKDAGTK